MTVPNADLLPDLVCLQHPDFQPYTARLAAAGSRRKELETLIAATPLSARSEDYAELIITNNITGKTTSVSRSKLFQQLKARYSLDPAAKEFQAFRAAIDDESNSIQRGLLCYLMMTRCDRLFREASLIVMVSRRAANAVFDTAAFSDALLDCLRNNGLAWSKKTTLHVQQHILSSLKDFGIVAGSKTRRFLAIRPGPLVMRFAAELAQLEGLTARQTLSSRWFKLLGLDSIQVADLLTEAHRAGALTFRMQAEVVELVLPVIEV